MKKTSFSLSLTEKLILLGIGVSPLFFWPWAKVPFEVPKVWGILVCIEVVIASFLWQLNKERSLKLSFSRGWLPLMGFAGAAIASSFLGVNLLKSWWGNYYRMDGLVVFLHLLALVTVTTQVASRKFWQILPKVWAISSSILAITTVVAFLLRTFVLHTWETGLKFGGPLGQSNFLGGYLAITLPLSIYQLGETRFGKEKVCWALGILAQLLALLLTQSKGGLLISLTAVVLTPILLHVKNFHQLRRFWQIGVIIGFICLGSLVGTQIFLDQQGFNAESRERVFHKLLLAIADRPLQGWGWANVDKAFEAHPWPFPILHDIYVDKAHSTILEVFVTTGLVGGVFYLWLIGQTASLLWKRMSAFSEKENQLNQVLFLVFLLSLAQAQLNVISISQELIFWVIVAFSLQVKKQ